MTQLLVLALSSTVGATPPLPAPPAPLSAPMKPVDIGGASVVFPRGAFKAPRPTSAEVERIGQMRTLHAPQIDPKIRRAALDFVSQGDSWSSRDPSRAETYRVIAGPRRPEFGPPCQAARRPGHICRLAHAGAAQGEFVRQELADGSLMEQLILNAPARSYVVSYTRFGRAAEKRLGASPGDAAAGERFIRSFRFAGQPVVLAPPAR